MFWHFLLAHFLADYPLQSNWMAAHKNRIPVLVLHTGIHLVIYLVVSGPTAREIWPFLLLLVGIHFAIDALKISVSTRWPDWITIPYLADQGLHYLTLTGIDYWIRQTRGTIDPLFDPRWAIIATGLLLTTYVWFISEKVLFQRDQTYLKEVIDQRWSRLFFRAAIWGGLLWLAAPQPILTGLTAAGIHWPYVSGQHTRRALLTDIIVVISMSIWVQWALGTT